MSMFNLLKNKNWNGKHIVFHYLIIFKIKINCIPMFVIKKNMKSLSYLILFENQSTIYNLINNFLFLC